MTIIGSQSTLMVTNVWHVALMFFSIILLNHVFQAYGI